MKKVKERVVYYNGKFVAEGEARISIYDSALMFGDMVFEMTRSFNKKQFMLEEHVDRLYASAKYLRIPLEEAMSKAEMLEAINQTIEMNEPAFETDDEHRLMIDVTRGLLGIYNDVVGVDNGINIIIADFPLKWTVSSMGPLFDTGINVVVPSQRAIPAALIDPKVKNRSRIHYCMANIQVANCKGSNNWALLLDTDNFVAEGTGNNFFIIKNGVIITPEGRNILRGISRDYIFILCDQLGLKCEEKNIDVYDVVMADEAFITGTPFSILPVTSIDGEKIADGQPGPLTKKLLSTWSENVGVDIEKQIKGWGDYCKNNKLNNSTPYSFSR